MLSPHIFDLFPLHYIAVVVPKMSAPHSWLVTSMIGAWVVEVELLVNWLLVVDNANALCHCVACVVDDD